MDLEEEIYGKGGKLRYIFESLVEARTELQRRVEDDRYIHEPWQYSVERQVEELIDIETTLLGIPGVRKEG